MTAQEIGQAELDRYGNFSIGSDRDLYVGCVIGDRWFPSDVELGKCMVVAKTTWEEFYRRKTELGIHPEGFDGREEFWLVVAE